MSVKCLCKIGILKTNQETDDDNSFTLTHNDKLYEPINNWYSNCIPDVSKHRDFCIVALKENDSEYLTIFRDGTRHPGRNRNSRENILSLCFPDFQSFFCVAPVEGESTQNEKTTMINDVTAKLYSQLKSAHLADDSKLADSRLSKIDRLQPELRIYQLKSVEWLLRREQEPATLNHFYKKLTSREGPECYVNLLNLDIDDELPQNIDIPSGGILAEEMGLGKTVEIISLILLNQRVLKTEQIKEPEKKKPRLEKSKDKKLLCVCLSTQMKGIIACSKCCLYQHQKCVRSYIDFPLSDQDDEYICPKCWEQEGTIVQTAATVIVSPSTIKLQWLSEINKHTDPPLKVLLYEGVSKHKISPKELASYDVVLTDYTILRQEIHFTASNEIQMSFRKERRRMRVNSPLVLVDWWRVCLDEAQMESTTSNASKTVKQLPAIHRWAVTGTPIQTSLDDLITLLDFIGFQEASASWKILTGQFNRGYSENMIKMLQKVMWRTSKMDVVDELRIPPQSEVLHFVELNDVEKLFYSDEHADCLSAFYDKIKGFADLQGVTNRDLKMILQPMLKLRQDCSIPVLCSKSENNVVKKFLQPHELLEHMKTTNELECKSQLRSMASIYNGMAALYFLQKNYKDAITYYERVMDLSKKYNGTISVDSLLQIHALYNAIQAYRTISSTDSPIINEYEIQCNKLEWKYLEPYAATLLSAEKGYISASNALTKCHEDMSGEFSEVWEGVLQAFEDANRDEQLLNKINDEVFLLHSSSLYERFRMLNSVLMVLETWYKKILKARRELETTFGRFDFFIQNVRPRNDVPIAQWRMMNAFIHSVYDCHLSNFRKVGTAKKPDENKKEKKKLCQLCEAEKQLQTLECLIFDKTLDEKTSNAEGTWNPAMQETAMKAIFSAVKSNVDMKELVRECELQLEAIALMKIEYKELVKLWIEIEYSVKAYDEMDMCKMRISLADPDEEKTNYSIYDYEIEGVLEESKINFDVAQKEFVLKNARLKYIQHLEGNTDPGACPICRSEGQFKYVVLECGHHLCFYCFKTIKQRNKFAKLTCSICRNQQKYENIYYVTRKTINKEGFEIKGDFSSKIQKIILEVIKLKSEDENVKIIMFSQWAPILKAIGEALNENDINFRINKSPQCVEQFKNEKLEITCLLMLLHNRAQGLNLTEATHVFLVEPILNVGEELQAIGRVHRIGQTKPTFVHRFIVQNTIEENIYKTLSEDKTKKSIDLTIENIKQLFEMHSYNS
ncbi:E3 ubiquitin-protein ligase SHPRH [Episyrphus balteatus]|uniref:E3 ubiquitin-protein ligase SHPRH n=1 Tax=Episyrphus balteatus TaxID=286459 RepID=UPI002485B1F3|nr:E3 ubiquitin-protein ligase SHPRH [Episyrphus balteatus]